MAGSLKLPVQQCDLIFYCYVHPLNYQKAKETNDLKQWLVQILQLIHWYYVNKIMLLTPHMLLLNKLMSS